MLSYPLPIALGLLESLRDPRWSWIDTHFEHANGTRLRLTPQDVEDEFHRPVVLVHLEYEAAFAPKGVFFFTPSLEITPISMALGTLYATPCFDRITPQDLHIMLHTQWGVSAQRHLRALSHVLAERFDADGGRWVRCGDYDGIRTAQQRHVALPVAHNRIRKTIDGEGWKSFQADGRWMPIEDMPLQRFASHHETMEFADHIARVQKLL